MAGARAAVGRLFPSSLSLFPLPKEAGTTSADAYDTQFSSIINGVISQIATIPSIRVPRNLPAGTSKALFALFGRYQLDPSGASSSHPALDSFRRITDKFVYDTYGALNIVEIGPSLTRMAARQDQCAAHSCSPNLDGRDRARALQAANIAVNNPAHPHANDLIARGQLNYQNPVWMCNNKGQDCQVQGRVLYSSFSLQDDTPATLVQAMRAHGTPIAIVNLELPIGLAYVDEYQEVETGAFWKKVDIGGVPHVQCFPGFGDAGYTHRAARLDTWLSGFEKHPLFVECLYQFGSAVCYRITLTGDENGCQAYPLILRTMMDKYAHISGDVAGIPDFLTSASHFERLVAYLTTHHDKFANNLFKAALERVSVLTPAIILGDDKYTDRWVLTSDQRISVAMAACIDVQKMMHRSTLGQRHLDMVNSELATSVRRAEAAMEPDIASRFTKFLRGETSMTSQRTLGDYAADFIDQTATARSLAQTTRLPDKKFVANGRAGAALPVVNPPIADPPPAPPVNGAGPARYVPSRIGFPQIDNLWPFLGEMWLTVQNAIPQRRGGRLLNQFDPAQNHAAAIAALAGMPNNALSQIQQRAVNNWDWDPQTCLDLLIVGPAGTGKSTHARRIAPPGACVVVPTNELQQHWQQVFPGHAVFTLDEAVANIQLVRGSDAIIIDEIYQFPAGHVITLCSLGIPVVGLGAPDQRRYNGNLGARFSHDIVPCDRVVLAHTVQRYGQDITDIVNNRAVPIYLAEYGVQMIGPAFQFVTTMPGVNNIQVQNAQRPGLHLTFHNANTNIFQGCITIDSSQGTDANNVYIHLFPGDEIAFAANPYAFPLALTRALQTVTVTVPAGTRNNSPLVQAMLRPGLLRANQLVRRGATVFGSRSDLAQHGFTSLDELDMPLSAEPSEYPQDPMFESEQLLTRPKFNGRPLINEEDDEEALVVDRNVLAVITPSLAEALYAIHPEPPQPAELTLDKSFVRFRKPDPKLRARIPEWIQTGHFHEPTLYHHIGYPFMNTEVLASIHAIFDRYLKPQNVVIPNKKALMLADIMFKRFCRGFLREDVVVALPSPAVMFASWFNAEKGLRVAQVAAELPFIDSGRPLQNEYFLKCQCKPKFKAFGFCAECGQGILATNKLLNATICPLIVAATKSLQLMLKPYVIYASGYSREELDRAVRATGAHKQGSLSIDLSQQDSSHTNVHRYFIAMVMKLLGFEDTIITLYLISRVSRTCKGIGMLGLMFEVLERLFSGEPGTGFFNFLMSAGTLACSHDLETRKPDLIIGLGDDETVSPEPPKLRLAINMVKETGVIQKCQSYTYLDHANRVYLPSGRSFMDPIRALAKYTLRMSKRDNTENERIAYGDFALDCNEAEFEALVRCLGEKHELELPVVEEMVAAAVALADPATYYANLRPSKVPVPYMPVVRMSGKHEVVFEDVQDQCAPAAIAYIADVPVQDVMAYVATQRLKYGVHPDVRAANRTSLHANAFFMDADEIKRACAHFGIAGNGTTGPRTYPKDGPAPPPPTENEYLSLKVEGNHIVVIRGRHAWRHVQRRGIYGSRSDVVLAFIFAAVIAYVGPRRRIIINSTLIQLYAIAAFVQEFILDMLSVGSPVAHFASLVPAYLVYEIAGMRSALWSAIIFNTVMRMVLYPFHVRLRKTKGYKQVRAARVEHALYGTVAPTRSYRVDKALLMFGILGSIVVAMFIIRNQWEMLDILTGETNVFVRLLVAIPGLILGIANYEMFYLALTFGWASRRVDYHYAVGMFIATCWCFPWHLPWYFVGLLFGTYVMRVLGTPHLSALRCSFGLWGVVFAYAMHIGTLVQDRKRVPPPSQDAPAPDDPVAQFTHYCLHNARRETQRLCRPLHRFCHPDKIPTFYHECVEAVKNTAWPAR